jgi:hypothetical protein
VCDVTGTLHHWGIAKCDRYVGIVKYARKAR